RNFRLPIIDVRYALNSGSHRQDKMQQHFPTGLPRRSSSTASSIYGAKVRRPVPMGTTAQTWRTPSAASTLSKSRSAAGSGKSVRKVQETVDTGLGSNIRR